MQNVQLSWNLYKTELETTVEKHCKNCGHTAIFTDTHIRRHNANGKNIYRFAIYKCEKGHTWNKKLHIYKTYSEHVETVDTFQEEHQESLNNISIMSYKNTGTIELTILLESVHGFFRIDKALATYISEWSRTVITEKIKQGSIHLNGQQIKPNAKLTVGDCISIYM
ncbi:cytoplasmic protein [Bacillus multifaciens]|uniref:cytoplasmic protein n=1 Tax=Bacillus multifaciens TaxID=3068506 RepID=UPI0027427E3B|nr:cytoplasmic protein [Bacillus sp. WLY-B-L8]MDP7979257.1 cytoplasmic protein [Bacillus sp. WLY-B-L8]